MRLHTKAYFHDEESAYLWLESKVWGKGATCPRCGGRDRITKVNTNPAKAVRIGLYLCSNCRRQFTVKVKTILHKKRMPLRELLQAVYLMATGRRNVTAVLLQRVLSLQYKRELILREDIRHAMVVAGLTLPLAESKVRASSVQAIRPGKIEDGRRSWSHRRSPAYSQGERFGQAAIAIEATNDRDTWEEVLLKLFPTAWSHKPEPKRLAGRPAPPRAGRRSGAERYINF
jgi:transposase-like protein